MTISSAAVRQTQVTRPFRLARILRAILFAGVMIYFLIAIGYLGLRYLVWPSLDDWRPRIVAQLSEVLGRPVSMGAIRTGFDGWRPVLQIHDFQLAVSADNTTPVLKISQLDAVVALRSFLTGQLRLARLQLAGPELDALRTGDGRVFLAGVRLGEASPDFAKRFGALLAQPNLSIRGGKLNFRDEMLDQAQTVSGIDVDIHNIGLHHKIDIKAKQLGSLAQNFELAADLFRVRGVKVDDWRQWHGDVYAATDNLLADALAAALGLNLPVRSARGELRFWADLEEGKLNNMQLKLSGNSMRVELPEESSILIDKYGAEATAVRRREGGFNIVVRSLFGQTETGFAVRALGNQAVKTAADGTLLEAQLAIEDIGLAGTLAMLKRVQLPAKFQSALAPMRGRGQLRGLRMNYSRQSSPEFDISLSFEQLSLFQPNEVPLATEGKTAPAGRPSLENLSGTAVIKADGGQIRFSGKNSALTFPGVFEEPRIVFDSLKGRVEWRLIDIGNATEIELAVDQVDFSNADAAGNFKGRFRSALTGPGEIELSGALSRGDPTRVARYLPTKLPIKVRQWVASSLRSGRISDARFNVKGDLANFPFRNSADGEFLIEAKLADLKLDFAPEWPPIESMRGTVRFAQGGMDIRTSNGTVLGFKLEDGHAHVADFREPLLIVDTVGQGPAQDLIRFVNESPVSKIIDRFTKDSIASGDARLKLRLDLPLDNLKASQARGSVDFGRNDLQLDAGIPKFDAVSGQLSFNNDGLTLKDLSAGFLGGRIYLEGETPEPGHTRILAKGSISAANLRALVDNPLTNKLAGTTDYRATLDIVKRNISLSIESDLAGLSSELPEPFRKTADQRWPLRVVVKPSMVSDPNEGANAVTNGDLIQVTLNEKSSLLLERGRDATSRKLLIQRGAFAYDAPPVLSDQGFVVLVNRNDINLDRWLDLLTAPSMQAASNRGSGDFAAGFSLLPNVVSIVADRLTVAGKDLHEVVFGASRTEGFWRANVSSRELSGHFNWNAAREGQRIGALTARFTRLEIPASRRGEIEDLIESSPQELPSLDVAAEELVLAERSLGRLSLQASSGGSSEFPTWRLNSLRVENPDATLQASGVWEPPRSGEARKTRLDYELNVADSGGLLARYGMKDVIRDGAGKLKGSLSWDGSPLGLQMSTLAGNTAIKLGKGQFLKTEPGLAKLISVLNLQFLPRRLVLDFSDVFADGFSFDEIEGTLRIENGRARTDALEMKGAQAKVRLKGEVDLARETQSLQVEVRPELNAGVASLAYAALANPALGLTTFVAQLLLRGPLEDIFTYNYDVSGTWADPKVLERRGRPAGSPRVESAQ